jgi:hypothetical protein
MSVLRIGKEAFINRGELQTEARLKAEDREQSEGWRGGDAVEVEGETALDLYMTFDPRLA